MDAAAFLAQAEDYASSGDLRDSVRKLLNLVGRPHRSPFIARPSCAGGWTRACTGGSSPGTTRAVWTTAGVLATR